MNGMTKGAAWGLIVLFLLLGVGTTFNYVTTRDLVRQSQHRWCKTLILLTSSGPPKAGTPNYQRSLTFYRRLNDLEHAYGCDSP